MPPVEEVRPGLWSIPVPIPDNPLRYVLVYALELAGGGVALVDAGWNTEVAWTALNDGLAAAGGSITDVRAVMVTHIHPDHYGLAGRVREASGAWIGLHPADAGDARGPLRRHRRAGGQHVPVPLQRRACPTTSSPTWPRRPWPSSRWSPWPSPTSCSRTGRPSTCPGGRSAPSGRRATPRGTSASTATTDGCSSRATTSCPRITPNISAHTQQVANPLGDFLASLAKLEDLPTDEVLPAHEYRFADLTGRLQEIMDHHADRLDEIEQVVTANTRRPPPGRSPSGCTGHAPGTRSSPSCSGRPTGRPWPTASCSSCTTGSGARVTRPARFFVAGA